MARREWTRQSKRFVGGKARIVWVDEAGNRIVRRGLEDYYLENRNGIYDLLARNFDEAVREVPTYLNRQK